MPKRPLSVWLIACLYLAVGGVGFVFHFPGLYAGHAFDADAIWIELTELVALICGVFLLLGHNWARWIAVVWIAFHVIISFPDTAKVAVHCAIGVLIVWALFHGATSRYFRRDPESGNAR